MILTFVYALSNQSVVFRITRDEQDYVHIDGHVYTHQLVTRAQLDMCLELAPKHIIAHKGRIPTDALSNCVFGRNTILDLLFN